MVWNENVGNLIFVPQNGEKNGKKKIQEKKHRVGAERNGTASKLFFQNGIVSCYFYFYFIISFFKWCLYQQCWLLKVTYVFSCSVLVACKPVAYIKKRYKQPPELLYLKKGVLRDATLLKRKCFPVNIAKFLRTTIFKNICELLLFKCVC